MAMSTPRPGRRRTARRDRPPLTRDRILRTAIDLADAEGVDALTMRRLGQATGVEAMSLYHHVASKDDLLGAVVDLLIDEIPAAAAGPDWQAALREQAMAGRAQFTRHPWAASLLVRRRTISPAYLRYLDRVTGIMLAGGLSHQLAHTAMHVLDTRVFGFSQEFVEMPDLGPEIAAILDGTKAHLYPHISETMADIEHHEDAEFAFALDLVLEGLEARRVSGTVAGG
jgi:AcrR family transcriptional regulator